MLYASVIITMISFILFLNYSSDTFLLILASSLVFMLYLLKNILLRVESKKLLKLKNYSKYCKFCDMASRDFDYFNYLPFLSDKTVFQFFRKYINVYDRKHTIFNKCKRFFKVCLLTLKIGNDTKIFGTYLYPENISVTLKRLNAFKFLVQLTLFYILLSYVLFKFFPTVWLEDLSTSSNVFVLTAIICGIIFYLLFFVGILVIHKKYVFPILGNSRLFKLYITYWVGLISFFMVLIFCQSLSRYGFISNNLEQYIVISYAIFLTGIIFTALFLLFYKEIFLGLVSRFKCPPITITSVNSTKSNVGVRE